VNYLGIHSGWRIIWGFIPVGELFGDLFRLVNYLGIPVDELFGDSFRSVNYLGIIPFGELFGDYSIWGIIWGFS
jgi:nitroreductase